MDFKDLQNSTEKELHDLLIEKREELRELKFKARENQLKNVREIRKVRKVIAQVLTLLNTKSGSAKVLVDEKTK